MKTSKLLKTISFSLGVWAVLDLPNGQFLPQTETMSSIDSGQPTFSRPVKMTFIVSMIWEGASIEDHNLSAVRSFRTAFPTLGLIHFISPAYFLKADLNPKIAETKIRSILKTRDELGMSLQGWKSLVQKSGVIFRSGPTFWGNQITPKDCSHDCGSDVPLSTYNNDELKKIFRTSIKTLEKHGFSGVKNLFVNGWMANHSIYEIASSVGFGYDYSAVSPPLVSHVLKGYPLRDWLDHYWPLSPEEFEPTNIKTSNGRIVEFGNSAAAVDYLESHAIVELFKKYLRATMEGPDRDLVFHLAFHQETAHQYLPRLSDALQKIVELAEECGVRLKGPDLPRARWQARRDLY